MNYFTCEGIFSKLYKYHVRLLIHFTGLKPLNLSYYLYKSLDKMVEKVQHRISDHQASLFHHALIKIIVLHKLAQMNITWETFIHSNVFLSSASQPTSQSTPSTPSKHTQRVQETHFWHNKSNLLKTCHLENL
jgi:hypothetical protein